MIIIQEIKLNIFRHDFPVFWGADVFQKTLSSQHIQEQIAESFTKSADKLTELQFISKDFR